jgi:hypothetical protein
VPGSSPGRGRPPASRKRVLVAPTSREPGSPRPADAWPAGGSRRRTPRRESRDEPGRPARPVTQLAHDSPGPSDQFPTLSHFPAYTSGDLAAIVTQQTPNAEEAGDRPPRPPAHRRNRSVQQRLPEIDTGRTLIARSNTASVGPGQRIGSVQASGSISNPGEQSATEYLFGRGGGVTSAPRLADHIGGSARACHPTADHAPRSVRAGRRPLKSQQADRKDGCQGFRWALRSARRDVPQRGS